LYDVAVFADGFEGPMLQELLDAYQASAQEYGVTVRSREHTAYVVDCFRLHKIVKSLAKLRDCKLEEETIARYIDRAEKLAASCAEAKAVLKHKPIRLAGGDLSEHPAVKAWRSVQPQQPSPANVQILDEDGKSSVYRLVSRGPQGATIIAKRCRRETAWVERTVYEEILPGLPITALRQLGYKEQDDGFCWLFVEDAGTAKYLPRLEEHRTRVTEWLALMHGSATKINPVGRLPDRGPNHYLEHLRAARRSLLEQRDDPRIDANGRALLKKTVFQLDTLESRWSEVGKSAEGIPSTLVHGDFSPKNVYIRAGNASVDVLPLDWETAGWGVPARDLSDVPIELYCAAVQQWWPCVSLQTLRAVANVGKLFQWVSALNWETTGFKVNPAKAVRNITVCRAWLTSAMEAVFSGELPS
jgi:hypothetical protein